MKNNLVVLGIAFISLYSSNLFANNPNEWTTYFDNDSVKIEFIYSNCEYTETFNQEFVILRIINKLNAELVISWKDELWYDDICANCEQDNTESRKVINIKAGERIEGGCNINSNLKIFSKFTDKIEDLPILGVEKIATLSRFELKNITVK